MESSTAKIYHHRQPKSSPFFRIVDSYFDEFERVYSQKFEKDYGFWRPVIHSSVEKFRKCGDLKQGFARIKCGDCGKEMFVPFSCHQRCSCPSCHQKRSLLLAMHLTDDVLAEVPHSQFVFTIPKRLRLFFKYDRSLLGKLVSSAWQTVREVYSDEVGLDDALPAMIAGIQTFGDLINWHPHIHAVVADGVFMPSGKFIPIPQIPPEKFKRVWENKVFDFLIKEGRIEWGTVESMKSWKHSGFSVDTSVHIDKGDKQGMMRLIQYIVRCPFSLQRMVKLTDDGKVLYRTGKGGNSNFYGFPKLGDPNLKAGAKRNFQLFEPLQFLAEVTQHIPKLGQHQIRTYGFYSNKHRGVMRKAEAKVAEKSNEVFKKSRATWAMLIKMIFEVDPLVCPECGGEMKIVSIIARHQKDVVRDILECVGLWHESSPPKLVHLLSQLSRVKDEFEEEVVLDENFFDNNCA
jgi:hypothetical protein